MNFNITIIQRIYSKTTWFILIFIFVYSSFFTQTIFDIARKGTEKEMINYLSNHPEHMNLLSDRGSSPVLLAAYYGNNDVARVLIENGAKLEECYSEGSLICALIYKNNIDLLETILKKGANINDTCQFEQFGYPLNFALTLQRFEVLELLLKYEPSLKVLDQKGRTISELLNMYKNPKLDEIFNRN
jgi:ankyrin repeat protein